MNFDVFNGDADGICALVQLRLAEPLAAELVTGIKRDIQLLERVDASLGDRITVLDISLDKNLPAVKRSLQNGAQLLYIDHHQASEIPIHPALTTVIDTDSQCCTSLLTNRYLQDRFPLWAITGAFGDNLIPSAMTLAKQQALAPEQIALLQALGTYINYNSYGDSLDDVQFAPTQLYQTLANFTSPLTFIAENPADFALLAEGYATDMAAAQAQQPMVATATAAVVMLPDAAWARRIQGVLGNSLANAYPDRAHAVLRPAPASGYQVSVRAPVTHPVNADVLCAAFPSGGGRKAAAGINRLSDAELEQFIQQFLSIYSA